jgi:hypothetical protein
MYGYCDARSVAIRTFDHGPAFPYTASGALRKFFSVIRCAGGGRRPTAARTPRSLSAVEYVAEYGVESVGPRVTADRSVSEHGSSAEYGDIVIMVGDIVCMPVRAGPAASGPIGIRNMTKATLGEFEALVVRAALLAGAGACGLSITNEIVETAGRPDVRA